MAFLRACEARVAFQASRIPLRHHSYSTNQIHPSRHAAEGPVPSDKYRFYTVICTVIYYGILTA